MTAKATIVLVIIFIVGYQVGKYRTEKRCKTLLDALVPGISADATGPTTG